MSVVQIQNNFMQLVDHEEMNPGKELENPADCGMISRFTLLVLRRLWWRLGEAHQHAVLEVGKIAKTIPYTLHGLNRVIDSLNNACCYSINTSDSFRNHLIFKRESLVW
jgi:hypothetical protein